MSNGKELQQKDFQFPTHPSDAFSHLEQIDSEIKRLNSLKSKYRKFLAKAIPVEQVDEKHYVGEFEGVKRMQYRQDRTSYQKVLDQVVEELVPKTKQDRVEEIAAENTKEVWAERFFQAEEDNYEL